MKNTLKDMNSRLGDKEECIADLEDAVLKSHKQNRRKNASGPK